MNSKKTYVIAEVGANHDREFGKAWKMIEVAAEAGANAVKFQTYSAETLYSKNTPDFAGYKNINKLIKRIEIPRHWQKDLKEICESFDVEFLSTPFDERAVEELYELGMKRFKIGSFEASDPRFVRLVASTGLPLVISLGCGANPSDIIDWVLEENKDPDITFLHCNSAYPTPLEDIRLGTIRYQTVYRKQFSKEICPKRGLSDHTKGILIPPVAVALGASVIEKHFTMDREGRGPDHSFAIEPNELKQMIENIRKVEIAMGERHGSTLTISEQKFAHAKRSIVAKKRINPGEIFTKDNITTIRPCFEHNIPAEEFYNILGKECKEELLEGEALTKWGKK